METLVLINADEYTQTYVKKLADDMKLEFHSYSGVIGNSTVAQLAAGECNESGNLVNKSILILCSVTEKHFDRILIELRKGECHLDYKASMTPTNANWTLKQMFFEMEKERISFLMRQ